ncbi:MAG: hypothetical protein GY765_06860 [bacterium]|nr:hypothetical protein [bacterium]
MKIMDYRKLRRKEFRRLMGNRKVPEVNQVHLMLVLVEFDMAPAEITDRLNLADVHWSGRAVFFKRDARQSSRT